jgi:secreted trypsin-like serine protease
MRRTPRLAVVGALAAISLLASSSASAQSDGSVQPKVVGGHDASISQYPWQAAVLEAGGGSAQSRQFCGGSLLTTRIVITAAHCVFDTDPDCPLICNSITDPPPGDGTARIDPNDVSTILGSSTLNGAPESGVIGVSFRSNYNPDFNGTDTPQNDVGYLVLAAGSGQTPIKIAGSDEGALWDPVSPVDISGWGETGSGFPNQLQAATVQIIDDGTCSGDYGADFDRNTMICAGFQSGGVDTCAGDSGGPLQAPLATGGYRLVGITSWGLGCAEPGHPGVYARIAQSTALGPQIASDVSSLETAFGLAHEPIFGSAVSTTTTKQAKRPFAKCKRIRDKKKRKRCMKKVRKRLKRA